MRRLALLMVIALPVWITACNSSTETGHQLKPSQAPAELTPVEDGRRIFLENCTGCHGKNADSNTPAGRAWNVPVLRSATVQALGDPQLSEIIRQGRGKMPAWAPLMSPADIDHVLVYLRTLRNN